MLDPHALTVPRARPAIGKRHRLFHRIVNLFERLTLRIAVVLVTQLLRDASVLTIPHRFGLGALAARETPRRATLERGVRVRVSAFEI